MTRGNFVRLGALSAATAKPGDKVIVSGESGDHGVTVMLARGVSGTWYA